MSTSQEYCVWSNIWFSNYFWYSNIIKSHDGISRRLSKKLEQSLCFCHRKYGWPFSLKAQPRLNDLGVGLCCVFNSWIKINSETLWYGKNKVYFILHLLNIISLTYIWVSQAISWPTDFKKKINSVSTLPVWNLHSFLLFYIIF